MVHDESIRRDSLSKNKKTLMTECNSKSSDPIVIQVFCVVCCFLLIISVFVGEVVWYPGGDITGNRVKHGALSLLQHRLPAHLMDLVSRATGNKPMYVRHICQ